MTDSTHRHGPRHAARQRAVDILFEAEFRDTDPVGIVEERIDLSRDESNQVKRVPEYTTAIVPGVAQALDEIDDAIAWTAPSSASQPGNCSTTRKCR